MKFGVQSSKLKAFCFLTFLPFLAACSEQDDTPAEYADWQSKNETYFRALVADTQSKVAGGDSSWQLLTRYSWPSESSAAPDYGDYVVVQKLAAGPAYEVSSPLLSDSVNVHYLGRLLPSTSYPDGSVFDCSYDEALPFDPVTAIPSKFAVRAVVTGFCTALQYMHRGDYWRVYIPYQLGYGTSDSSSGIPAYSTLIFDLRLEDFWSKKKGDRP